VDWPGVWQDVRYGVDHHTLYLRTDVLQAKTIVGPLDRVKILFQTSNPQFAKYTGSWYGLATAIRDINRTEGIRGLFRGHSATLLRIFPYAGIKFLAYEQIRAFIIPSKASETHVRRFVSGSLAGVTSVFFTYPLEVIRVRLAFETKKNSRSSLSRICKQIYNEHPSLPPVVTSSATGGGTGTLVQQVTPRSGLANFYRGFTPTLVGMLPYAGMSFLTHDTIGDWLRHPTVARYTVLPSTKPSSNKSRTLKTPRRAQLNAPAELTAGAIAGLVSQTASYPLEVIRRRMQVGGAVGDGHRMGMAETARNIFIERGWRGFFVGLAIGYIKVVSPILPGQPSEIPTNLRTDIDPYGGDKFLCV
jgi:solute carrier family 25 (mitochondrial carrier protein), member 16